MKHTMRLGTVGGVPVRAHWSALVTLALVTWLLATSVVSPAGRDGMRWPAAIAGAVLFLLALLAHEGAHAWVAHRNRVAVGSVTLWLLGGVAELRGDPPDAGAALRIAGVGPLVSLVCAGLFGAGAGIAGLLAGPGTVIRVLWWLAVMNVLLAGSNLLPGAPLDGGRILAAVVWWRTGSRQRGTTIAARSGQAAGVALIGLGAAEFLLGAATGGLWLILVGWFLSSSAATEESVGILRTALAGRTVRDALGPVPLCASGTQTVAGLARELPRHPEQDQFPLIGFDGRPTGIVALTDLVRVPVRERATTRLSELVRFRDAVVPTSPDEPLTDLLERMPPARAGVQAVVLYGGVVVGLLGPQDLLRAAYRAQLGVPVATGLPTGTRSS